MSSTDQSAPTLSGLPKQVSPQINPWIIAGVVTLATFMEVLDTSIANVALPHIAGNLSSSLEESTWVLTSYLVANAIVIPTSGWLSSIVGRKPFFMICVTIFTISSALCGMAGSLGMLVLCRVLQGLGGGGLQPSVQAVLVDLFPGTKRGMAMAAYTIAVLVAPVLGPTLGGWITENYSWRWIFYINIPVGIVCLIFAQTLLHDPPYLVAQRLAWRGKPVNIDYIGLALISLGLACLEIVLDKGQQEDWFASRLIVGMAIVGGLALLFAIVWELDHPHPIVNLRLLAERNFMLCCIISIGLYACVYACNVLLPQLMQTLMGYSPTKAGLILSPAGLFTMALVPFVGYLLTRGVDPRILIGLGLAIAGGATLWMGSLDARQVGELQRALLPATLPQIAGLEIAVSYEPSGRAGGDLYDFFPLDERHNDHVGADAAPTRWCVFIGDATGHGLAAAVVMAIVQSVLHAHPVGIVRSASLLAHVNRQLCRKHMDGLFTAFLGIYEPVPRRLTYANAGHPRPLLRRSSNGSVCPLDAVALLIAVFGIVSIVTMQADIFPEINIPVVSVIWTYGGLSPTEMQDRITTVVAPTSLTGTATGLFEVSQIDTLRVFVSVPQVVAQNVKIGMPALIAVRGSLSTPVTATVTRTANSLDPGTRTLLTEVDIPNSAHAMLPGAFVYVDFKISPVGKRWNIPATALIFNGNGTQVMLVVAANKLHLQKVVVGRDFGDTVDIQAGLKGDETIVEQPDVSLADGQVITPVESQHGSKD